jgi:hypothetical protein
VLTVHLTERKSILPESSLPGTALQQEMSWDDLIYLLDFCYANRCREIAFACDNGDIRRHFTNAIIYAARRDFRVCIKVISALPEWLIKNLNEEIEHCGVGNSIRFIFRANNVVKNSDPSTVCFFRAFSDKISLEYLFNQNADDLSPFFDLIAQYKLRQEIKIHFAPEPRTEDQPHISVEELRQSAERLGDWIPRFLSTGVVPIFDRSLPLCSFTDEILGKCCRAKAAFSWHAAPEIDVFPELSLRTCNLPGLNDFPSLLQFNTMAELENHFTELMEKRKISSACQHCSLPGRELCSPALHSL